MDYYLAEVKQHWKRDPEFVSGAQFYSAWENVQRPLPFTLKENTISIAGQNFKITDDSPKKVACFQWDYTDECMALIIEGDEWVDRILIHLDCGDPLLIKQEPVHLEEMGLSYGERLEIIYDVIAYLKEVNPGIDLLSITKKEFIEGVEGIEKNYDPKTLSVMKRLSKHSIERFIRKAAKDMTNDEMSPQLTLPLNGTYASFDNSSEEGESYFDDAQSEYADIEMEIPARTSWEVTRDLQIQEQALRFALADEQEFILSFADAKIVETSGDKEILFQLEVKKESPLVEGDRLKVLMRGTKEPIASFKVDIFDNTTIYGRMSFFDSAYSEGPFNRIYALPRRSPLKFLAESIENLIKSIEENKADDLLMKITGLVETQFIEGLTENIPAEMDSSQQRAWSCAVNDKNPLTLIQGPPGTGKSKVLVDVVRTLCNRGKRILITAPSNTAVDNICRKLTNIPLLRFGKNENSIASDVAESNWIGNDKNVMRFSDMRKQLKGGAYAGTHIGLLWDEIVQADVSKNGRFDAIIFDEAGMASINEFLLLSCLAKKVVLFGDHKQLPPFPLSQNVREKLNSEVGPFLSSAKIVLDGSALEWLAEARSFPVILLKRSYRCQNPRLLRFSSILFYDAMVSPSETAEYYKLSYAKREEIYPRSTLKLISTSQLPESVRNESLVFEGTKPGIENRTEALLCIHEIYRLIKKYPINEVTLIAPYKRQVKLVRSMLSYKKATECSKEKLNKKIWDNFLKNSISTVDSFQGGESDAVIICYVRSNKSGSIGFVDDANRINVAHTRSRKEMVVIGDIECLKSGADNEIFQRLERTIKRDGEVVMPNTDVFRLLEKNLTRDNANFAEIIVAQKKSIPKEPKKTPAPPREDEDKINNEKIKEPPPIVPMKKDKPPAESLIEDEREEVTNNPLDLLQPDLFN